MVSSLLLAVMNRLFTIGVGIYILFTIFLDHGYYMKQKPHVTVDPVLTDDVRVPPRISQLSTNPLSRLLSLRNCGAVSEAARLPCAAGDGETCSSVAKNSETPSAPSSFLTNESLGSRQSLWNGGYHRHASRSETTARASGPSPLQWSNGTIPDRTNLGRFPYCAPLVYDYAWSDDVTYLNNSCIAYLT